LTDGARFALRNAEVSLEKILGGVAGVTVWVALVLKGGTYGWNWLWF
jgi:hypothetical protein